MRHPAKSIAAVLAAALGGLVISGASRADGIDRATALSFACTTCHGPTGLGSRSVPKIRGLDSKDLEQSMKGFRSGEEQQTIMGRIAQGYSIEELELLAQYFAKTE
ncbi:MAG: c-type cytochrome [Steroidobacteraceae bacterium]